MSSEAAASAVPAVAPAADRLTELKAARQALKRQLAQATREVKSQDTDCGPVYVRGTATMPCGSHQCHCNLPSCPINQSCTINHTSSREHCIEQRTVARSILSAAGPGEKKTSHHEAGRETLNGGFVLAFGRQGCQCSSLMFEVSAQWLRQAQGQQTVCVLVTVTGANYKRCSRLAWRAKA